MTFATPMPPAEALTRLIDRHGARAILIAFIAALRARTRARRALRRAAAPASDHLRRDIGLPPHASSPRHWDIR